MNTAANTSIRGSKAGANQTRQQHSPIATRYLSPVLRYPIAPSSCKNIVVATGEHVHCGQTLVTSTRNGPASIHAGSSGFVTCKQIGDGDPITIEIATDGSDSRLAQRVTGDEFLSMSSIQLQQLFHDNGLVGLGGACFPVAGKLSALESRSAKILLINAVECDPAIQCDRALLLAHASTVIRGISIAAHASRAQKIVVAVKTGDIALHTAVQNALERCSIENTSLCEVSAAYPIGFERHLFDFATGVSIPENKRPTQLGLISFNVATCFAMARLIDRGEPLFSRVTTVHEPLHGAIANLHVRLGTPLDHLLQKSDASLQTIAYSGLISEELSTGTTAAISPASNCVILNPEATTQHSCIRCGLCADVCPESLQPQQLLLHSQQGHREKLARHQLDRCIECGCCDAVCPSGIPLTRSFQRTKKAIHQQEIQIESADRAKQRFAARQNRLERQSAENEAKLARKQAALNQREKQTSSKDPRKQLLESALRRRGKKTKPNDPPAPK